MTIEKDTALGGGLYAIMVEQAAQLIEPDDTIHDNPEYIRGMCELIASAFPRRGMYTAETAKMVAGDMGIKQDIYVACDKWREDNVLDEVEPRDDLAYGPDGGL